MFCFVLFFSLLSKSFFLKWGVEFPISLKTHLFPLQPLAIEKKKRTDLCFRKEEEEADAHELLFIPFKKKKKMETEML